MIIVVDIVPEILLVVVLVQGVIMVAISSKKKQSLEVHVSKNKVKMQNVSNFVIQSIYI